MQFREIGMVADIIAMRMAGEDGHVVTERGHEIGQALYLLAGHHQPARAAAEQDRGVGTDIHPGIFIHQREVLLQPGELFFGKYAIVGTVAGNAGRLLALAFYIDIEYVVQENPMVVSYIHRVLPGAPAVPLPPA